MTEVPLMTAAISPIPLGFAAAQFLGREKSSFSAAHVPTEPAEAALEHVLYDAILALRDAYAGSRNGVADHRTSGMFNSLK